MDFIQVVDRIFKNRDLYNEVTDEDKINNFFIINRKFGKQFPEIAQKLNHKSIDKASAIDMWYEMFKGAYKIPDWYWDNRKIKNKKTIKKDFSLIQKKEDLKDFELNFLQKYFKEDLKNEMKKLEKYDF